MKSLMYAIHLVASIGGGLLGLITIAPLFLAKHGDIKGALIGGGAFGVAYLVGIIGGIAYGANRSNTGLLKLFYLLQIPVISSSALVYEFSSVLSVIVGFNLFETAGVLISFGAEYKIGSHWQLWINPGIHFAAGVNLIAIVLLALIGLEKDATLSNSTK